MGVCIETSQPVAPIFSHLSHPIWVCVLKQSNQAYWQAEKNVTPYMGVCIETTILLMIGL